MDWTLGYTWMTGLECTGWRCNRINRCISSGTGFMHWLLLLFCRLLYSSPLLDRLLSIGIHWLPSIITTIIIIIPRTSTIQCMDYTLP